MKKIYICTCKNCFEYFKSYDELSECPFCRSSWDDIVYQTELVYEESDV